jgi:hypothetical protein
LPEDELRREAVQLPAEARARLADFLRESVAHLENTSPSSGEPATEMTPTLDTQSPILPDGVSAAVSVASTGDVAALVHLAQNGPVQLVRDGILVAVLTGTRATR